MTTATRPSLAPPPELLYRDVCDAYRDLEDALERHDCGESSEAAKKWWLALAALREARDV